MTIAEDNSSKEQLSDQAPGLLLELLQEASDPEQLRNRVVQMIKMELADDDKVLMDECRKFSRERIKRHRHHTACVIRVDIGEGKKKFRRGLQRTYRRMAGLERCAEEAALADLDTKGGIIISAVAMHYLPQYPEHPPVAVCPCPQCAERWERQQQDQPDKPFGVIIPYGDEIIKVPSKWLGLFRYESDYAPHIDAYPKEDTNGS